MSGILYHCLGLRVNYIYLFILDGSIIHTYHNVVVAYSMRYDTKQLDIMNCVGEFYLEVALACYYNLTIAPLLRRDARVTPPLFPWISNGLLKI